MPEENVRKMREAYAAINRGDIGVMLALTDPEVEFVSLIAESEGRTYRGHDGVREWWETVKNSLGGLHFEAEEVRGLDDCTVAKLLVTARAGGVAVPQRMWHATRFRDGKAIWWGVYRTEADALETAGLSE